MNMQNSFRFYLVRFIGRIAFWVSWPLLFIYLFRTNRTRVIVWHQDKFLAVSPWLSSGQWILPGGGLHRGELAIHGAIREVFEETGLQLAESNLQYLGKYRARSGFRFSYDLFVMELTEVPLMKAQRTEIAAIQWLLISSHNNLDAITVDALAVWREQQDLLH